MLWLRTLIVSAALIGSAATAQAQVVGGNWQEAARGISLNQSMRAVFSSSFRSRLNLASHYHRERLNDYYDRYPSATRPYGPDRRPGAFVASQAGWSDFGELDFSGGTAPQSDGRYYTVEAGWDGMAFENLFAGIGAFYGFSEASSDAMEAELSTGGMTAYGRYFFGDAFVDAQLSYAYQDLVTRRLTVLGDIATGNGGGHEIAVEIAAGYDFWFGAWSLSPQAGFQYVREKLFDFDEPTMFAEAMTIGPQKSESLLGRVEVTLATTVQPGRVLAPAVHATVGFETDLAGTGYDLWARDRSGGPTGRVSIEDRDRSAITGGIGAIFPITRTVRADVNYDGSFALSGVEDTTHVFGARLIIALD